MQTLSHMSTLSNIVQNPTEKIPNAKEKWSMFVYRFQWKWHLASQTPLANKEGNVIGFMQQEPLLNKETRNSFACVDSLHLHSLHPTRENWTFMFIHDKYAAILPFRFCLHQCLQWTLKSSCTSLVHFDHIPHLQNGSQALSKSFTWCFLLTKQGSFRNRLLSYF